MAAAADVWGQRGKILCPGLSRGSLFGASGLLTHFCPSSPRGLNATGSGLEGTRPQKSWFTLLGFRPAPSPLWAWFSSLTKERVPTESWTPPVRNLRELSRPKMVRMEPGPLCSSLKPQALCPGAQTSGHSPASGTYLGPCSQHPARCLFQFLFESDFWPLILIPVNMIHEGPGLGSAAGLLEPQLRSHQLYMKIIGELRLGKGRQLRGGEQSVSSGLLLSQAA